MEFKDLLSLYFERSNAMQMYWNFYITIILALLAFFATVKLSSRTKYVAALLTLAFAAFAVVNLQALRWVDQQRLDAKALIESGRFEKDLDQRTANQFTRRAPDANDLDTPSVSAVTTFHIVGDVLVVAAIWVLALSKKSKTAELTE